MKELIKELQTVAERCDLDDDYDMNDCAEDVREIANKLNQLVTNCNQLKMREALKQAQRVLHCAIVAGIFKGEDAHEALNVVTAALSAPPRNCDVFEGHRVEDEFEKAMKFTPSQTADERDELMRENWFLFKLWLFAEAKGETKCIQ